MDVNVNHLAKLSNLPISDDEAKTLSNQFEETLHVIDNLSELDVTGILPTPQVTGLSNILRDDEVDTSRIFTQREALQNAPKSHQGYFVVPAIFD